MDTKRKGDIAEQAAILAALNYGWEPLKPIGDRLAYDLVFDVSGSFVRIQVKSAWYCSSDDAWFVDCRKTKTNRRRMKREKYTNDSFDFALVYLDEPKVFYILPSETFNGYAGSISFVESTKRQRKPRTATFREAWHLISCRAAHGETHV